MSHSMFSPSAAHRWLRCAAAPRLEAAMPRTDSEWSLRGTLGHAVACRCLTLGIDPEAHVGSGFADLDTEALENVPANDPAWQMRFDDASGVRVYVDHVRARMRAFDILGEEPDLRIEEKVFVNREVYGTPDAVIVGRTVLAVIDLKLGGNFVEAEENEQLLTYALAVWLELDDEHRKRIAQVNLTIVQPHRADEEGQAARTWTTNTVRLKEHQKQLDAAVRLALADNPTPTPGEHCSWCKAAGTCPALRERSLAATQQAFGAQPLDFTALTPVQVGELLDKVPVIEEWLAAFVKHAEGLARSSKIPGRKLVEKIGNRRWKDEAAVAASLKAIGIDPFAAPEVISPAEAERRLGKNGKKMIDGLTERPVTGVVLVPDSDRRPELNTAAKFLGSLLD